MTVGPGAPGGGMPPGQAYEQFLLAHGGLDQGLGQQVPAGGARSAYQTAQSQEVTVVRDDALLQLMSGLREDFSRFIDMQRQFNMDKQQEMSTIREQLRQTRAQMQGSAVAEASGMPVQPNTEGYTRATGHESGAPRLTTSAVQQQIMNPLGGYVSAANLRPMTQMMGPQVPWMGMGMLPFGNMVPTNWGWGGGPGTYAGPAVLPGRPRTPGVGPQGPVDPSQGGGGHVGGGGMGGGGGGGGGMHQTPTPSGTPHSGGYPSSIPPRSNSISGNKVTPFSMYQEYLSQAAKNRRFQEVEGGTNVQAFSDRASEFAGRFGHLSMSGHDYQAAFEGMSQLGYRGGSRDQGINTINHWQNSMGMNVSDSLKLIGANATGANESLETLNEHLQNLTSTAREFGVNAKMARDMYTQSYTSAANAGLGTASASVAAISTQAQVSLGRQFAGQANDSQVLGSITGKSIIAAQSGMTVNQVAAAAASNPATAARLMNMPFDQAFRTLFGSIIPQVQQSLQALGGGTAYAQDPQGTVDYLYNQFQGVGTIPWDTIPTTMYQMTRKQYSTPQAVFADFVKWLVQNGQMYQPPAGAPKVGQTGSATTAGVASHAPNKISGLGPLNGLANDVPGSGLAARFANDTVGKVPVVGGLVHHFFGGGGNSPEDSYKKFVASSGGKTTNASAPIQALLQKMGGQNPDVEVLTPAGPRKLSLSDAIEHFPYLVATGQMKVLSGSMAGQWMQSADGGYVDTADRSRIQAAGNTAGAKSRASKFGSAYNPSDDMKRQIAKDLMAGKDPNSDPALQAYLAQHGGTTTSSGGTNVGGVQIGLSPGAQKLIALIPSGSGNNPGDATGNPLSLNPGGGATFTPTTPP